MAATAARMLLRNSKSLPQILRSQLLGQSNITSNLDRIYNDHKFLQILFVSNRNLNPQLPLSGFGEMGGVFGSFGGQNNRPMQGETQRFVVEARGRKVVSRDEEEDDGDDEPFDDLYDDDEEEPDFDDDDDDGDGFDDDDDDGDDDEKGFRYRKRRT